MKTKIFKRSVSALMALVLCLTALVSTGAATAYAAAEKAKVYIVSFPRSGDEKKSGNWGHNNLQYMNGWTSGANDFTVTRALNTYEGQVCYCIEPGVSQHTGDSYTNWGENFWEKYPSSYNSTISPDNIKLLIGRIMQYGYTGNISTSWLSQNEGGDKIANVIATQLLIWETVVGERDENFGKVSTGGKNAVLEQTSEHPLKSKIMSHYNRIVSSVQSHTKLPSFMAKAENLAQSLDFNWNGEKHILELTDTNNVLANYSFSASEDGISFSVSGNKLTISAKNLPSDSVTITANKTSSKRRGIVTWTDEKIGPNGGIQDVVTYAQSVSDPVQGFVKLNVVKKKESLVEIVKKDAETDKVIPVAGIGFKVRDCATGEFVVQNDTDIYYTNATGRLTLPEALKVGRYELVEVQTAEGYVLDGTPVEFTVDGSNEVVTVEKKNTAQKGKITINKTGEIFASVKESDGKYQPVYKVKGLEGATYEVTAAEDISTPDGTQHYAKGDVVATITTDENGFATTEPIYLGKYEIREISVPYGMVINDEAYTVELVYAGQDVEVTETSVSFVNERQKAAVQLSKLLEQDENFDIGMNDEITSVSFGLYASENLTAADGSVIPKDGLLEIISCDQNGRAEFKTDIPVGARLYVKEIATDSHYLASSEKYPVNFEYAGQDVANIKLLTNYGEYIKNTLIRGKIVGKKVDENGNVIKGALFGLFKNGTEIFSEETAILTAESDENGAFVFDNVPYGDWLVRELKPTEGFVLNETVYNATVSENGQTVEIEVVNEFITGGLELTKRDVASGKLLPNAGFRIKYESGEIAAEGYTDENGIAKFTLRYGKYTYEEFDAPEGYLIDTTPHEFEITEDGQVIKAEMTNEKIPVTEIPQTGDNSLTEVWLGLAAIALGGIIALAVVRFRKKKDEGGE